MSRPTYRKQVEKAVKDGLKTDKARTRVSRISANGLLEINRQRLRQPLAERHFVECPTCQGRGRIPNLDTASVQLLRRLEARAATGHMKSVVVRLHPQMADTFQNSRRRELAALEEEFGIRIDVKASPVLERLDEDVQWTPLSKEERNDQGQANGGRGRQEAAVEAVEITQPKPPSPQPGMGQAVAVRRSPPRDAKRPPVAMASAAPRDRGVQPGAPALPGGLEGAAEDAAAEGAEGAAGAGRGGRGGRRRRGGRSRRGGRGRKKSAAPPPAEGAG